MSQGLTKRHSTMLYGLAIILMLYHHMYCIPSRLHYEYISVLDSIFSPGTEERAAWFCKICVAIYAFISGYAYHAKYGNVHDFLQISSGILKQCLFLFLKLWIVCAVFIPVGLMTGAIDWNLRALASWFLGSSINSEWWYVFFYITVLISFPVLDAGYRIVKGYFSNRIFSFLTSAAAIFIMTVIFAKVSGISKYILIFMIGYLASDWNLFAFIDQILLFRKRTADKLIASGLIFLLCVVFRCITARDAGTFWMDAFIIVPFVYSSITLLEKLQSISKILCVFGKYSTYMWLTHTFFIYYYFQKFSMITGHSTLMLLQLTGISLVTAMILQRIEKYVYLCITHLKGRLIPLGTNHH